MTKTITCPRCGARAHWENEDQTFEFSTPGLIGRILRPHHYQQTAAPPWGYTTQPTPVQPEQKSVLPTTEMQPGEKRERKEYRPKSVADILPGFAYSVVFGGAVGGIAVGAGGTPRQVIASASSAFAVSFLITTGPVVLAGGANVVSVLEKLTRTDWNGDGRIGDIAVDLTADVPTGPQTMRKTRVTIPLSQIRAWRGFCQDVTGKRCNFSGNAFEDHDGDRRLFDRIVAEWTSTDPALSLIDPDSVGERKTLRLTPLGEETVKLHGTAPLPELLSLLERLTGTDRQQTDRRRGDYGA